MTVKFTRSAANQYISTPDNAALTFPAGDWTLFFILGLDGITTGDNPQYLVSNGNYQAAGSLNVTFQTDAAGVVGARNRIAIYAGTSSSILLTSANDNVAGQIAGFALSRVGTALTLRRCPILASAPANGAAVVADGSATLTGALDGPAGMFIGGRADLLATRFCDQSMGRVFVYPGALTDLEIARLCYGEEITDLGKTPTWYVRLDTVSDNAGRGSAALPWAVNGAVTTSATQPAFGSTPAPAAPVITGVPVLNTSPVVGAAVGYTPAAVTGTSTRTQQWTLDGVNITGATAATYTPVAGDAGKALRVRQIETNASAPTGVTATSNPSTVAAATSDAVTAAAMPAERIYQRSGTSSAVPMSGTYTGTTPTSIEYQLYAEDGTTVLKTWAVVPAPTISGGNWSGTPLVPQGGMYRRQVRTKNGTTVLATGAVETVLFGVGDLHGYIGSSSAEKMFDSTGGTGLTPAANVRKYNENGWAKFGTVGAGITLANSLAAQAGIPIGLLDYGIGGTTLAQWNVTTGAQWTPFAAGVAAVGGKLAGVITTMGSNDVGDGIVTSMVQHRDKLRQAITNVRVLTGQASLPICLSGFNRRGSVNADQANWVRTAENIVGDDANVTHVQTIDFALASDAVHLTPASFIAKGARIGAVWGRRLYGDGAYLRGPKASAFTWSGSTVYIALAHRNGTDFTPTTGILYFTASDDSGALTLTVARNTASQIVATANRAIVGTLNIDYFSGGNPGTGAQVTDNGTPPLPMHPESEMVATKQVSTPPPQETATTIASVTFENTGTTDQTNAPQTFGHPFAEGHLPSGAAVELVAPDGAVVPCQLDVKAAYSGGSVKHAVLSVIVPSLPASASVTYGIRLAASAPVGAAPVFSDFSGLNAVATLTYTGLEIGGPLTGATYTADAAVLMAQGKFKTWLSGPICSEWIVRAPLVSASGAIHPDMHVRFEIRAYKGVAKARIHCIVENGWAKAKAVMPATGTPWEETQGVDTHIYSYSIKIGGAVVDSRSVGGYHRLRFTGIANAFDATLTGLPNDATVYTASVNVDGVTKPISVIGSQVQTFKQLRAAITAQLGGLGDAVYEVGGMKVVSRTTGAGSRVVVTDGTLFTKLVHGTRYRPIYGNEHIHYSACRWQKTFWWGGEPSVHIRHDKAYLTASGAVPNYDPTVTGDPTSINSRLNQLNANGDLGQSGISKPGMAGQGGAPGIGILPEWQAFYFVNQGKVVKDIMLRQAALMGSYAVIYRDFDTDLPVDFARWPRATLSPNANDSKNPVTGLLEKLPPKSKIPTHIPGNENLADVAHHPDFNFLPYLVTGDHCYMEGLLMYFTFISLSQNPAGSYRDGAKVLFRREQVRAQAWMFRSLVHNLYLLPDNHPNRPALDFIMASNVEDYRAKYLDPASPQHSIFGRIGDLSYTVKGVADVGASLFMDDFMTQTMGRAVELGFDELRPMFEYKSRSIKGRLTSGRDFCWQAATYYSLRYKETPTSPEYTSWREIYENTVTDAVLAAECGTVEMGVAIGEGLNALPGYPTLTEGFPANMQPAVAYGATFNMPSGDDAWTVFDGRAKKANYNKGPQFAIVPRLAEAQPPAVVTDVVITPSSATDSQQFSAIVNGTGFPSQAVAWSKEGAGSLTSTGLFVRPDRTEVEQVITIKATSVADPSKFATATVTVSAAVAPAVTDVIVTPANAVIPGGTTLQFSAEVLGENNPSQDVTWTTTLGVINSQGLLVAQAVEADQIGTAIATSVQDPTQSGSALFIVESSKVTDPVDPEVPPVFFTPSAARTVRILAGRQVFDTGAFWTVNGTLGPVGSKDPNATIDIPFDWSAWLADIGNPALSAIDFLLSPGLTSPGAVLMRNDGKLIGAAVLVSEGATTGGGNGNAGVGPLHTITCRITTATEPARIEDRTVVLQIKEQ